MSLTSERTECICRCIYCGTITGRLRLLNEPDHATICFNCVWSDSRDERREVEARMPPWVRTEVVGTPMPEAEAQAARERYSQEQERIAASNRAPSGVSR